MAAARPVGLRGLDFLITASIRIPCGVSCLMGAALAGEVSRRGINDALGWIGFTESKVAKLAYSYIPEYGRKLLSLTSNMNYQELTKASLSLCAIGVIGWELSGVFLGQPHPLYNRVLSVLGPVRLAPATTVIERTTTERFGADGNQVGQPTTAETNRSTRTWHHPIVQFFINWWTGTQTPLI
jgi:hypothetical protein